MRKVMFTKDAFIEKLQAILNEFPVLEVSFGRFLLILTSLELAPFYILFDEVCLVF